MDNTLECARDVSASMDLAWDNLHKEGITTTEEFESCTSSIAFRNSQEIKDPFENGNMSLVRQAGLNLLKGPEDFYLPCSIKQMWREKLHMDGVEDRKLFAFLLINALRLPVEATLRNTLRKTRTAEEQSSILEQFYERFIKQVSTLNPETFQSEPFIRGLVAQKLK
ncbi:uncharacterized protein LOC112574932 [Pomacea canaliculata]|uniref:uncharacterized protein LOC112574932 n=1 Tax=Pomacea canaliculata TaxID=400727 RepID=UPI000D7304D4|nr:uncharacterized protein LOC112574932 [Pomacea canaliculata]